MAYLELMVSPELLLDLYAVVCIRQHNHASIQVAIMPVLHHKPG